MWMLAAVSARDHDYLCTADEVVQGIGETEQVHTANVIQHHTEPLRLPLDQRQGRPGSAEELKTEARAATLIPLEGFPQIGSSRWPKKQTRRHAPRCSMSSRASRQG